jgi:hypothetical protein
MNQLYKIHKKYLKIKHNKINYRIDIKEDYSLLRNQAQVDLKDCIIRHNIHKKTPIKDLSLLHEAAHIIIHNKFIKSGNMKYLYNIVDEEYEAWKIVFKKIKCSNHIKQLDPKYLLKCYKYFCSYMVREQWFGHKITIKQKKKYKNLFKKAIYNISE